MCAFFDHRYIQTQNVDPLSHRQSLVTFGIHVNNQ